MDNDSARAAYGSCTSRMQDSFNMRCVSARVDNMLRAYHWYTHVPSCAIVSDPASRLDSDNYDSRYVKIEIDWTCDELVNLMNAECLHHVICKRQRWSVNKAGCRGGKKVITPCDDTSEPI